MDALCRPLVLALLLLLPVLDAAARRSPFADDPVCPAGVPPADCARAQAAAAAPSAAGRISNVQIVSTEPKPGEVRPVPGPILAETPPAPPPADPGRVSGAGRVSTQPLPGDGRRPLPADAAVAPPAPERDPGPVAVVRDHGLPEWVRAPPPGLRRAAGIPGPASTAQALVGALAPGLVAVVGGLLGGLFGSPLPGAAVRPEPAPPQPASVAEAPQPPSEAEAAQAAAADEAARRAEWVRQREEDLRQIRENQAFVAAAAAGARQGGFDVAEHDRRLRDLAQREKEVAGQIAAAGGDSSWVARPREVIPVGDGFKEAIRSAMEQQRQAALAAARLRMDELLKAQQAADRNYWNDVRDGFWGGVVSDVDAIPGQLADAAKAGLRSIGQTVGGAGDALADSSNWRALGQAIVRTGADLVGSPLQSVRKVGGFYVDAAGAAGSAAASVGVHIATHPVDTLKTLAGADNWSRAMDPNVPVSERIGRVLVGIADAATTLGGAGLAGKGLKGADAAVDAAKVADHAATAVRRADQVLDAGRAADKAGDLRKAGRAGEAAYAPRGARHTADAADQAAEAAQARADLAEAGRRSDAYFKDTQQARAARDAAWQQAQAQGLAKVDEFDQARIEARKFWKSDDAAAKAAAEERLRKATLEVQRDKQALWQINRRPEPVKRSFNTEMEGIYRNTDRQVVDQLCRARGIDASTLVERPPGSGQFRDRASGVVQVEVVKPTNPKPGVNVGADRDVTVRVRQVGDTLVADPDHPGRFIRAGAQGVLTDVPARELSPVYNQAFHRASDAGKHFPGRTADQIAHEMDQVATDRLHAEAYGRGQKDLQVAISKPGEDFSDAEQVAQAARYKSEHLYQQARELAAKGRLEEAETTLGEGMRQATKQFDRQVLGRAQALQEQGVKVNFPRGLQDDIAIMKKAQTQGWSPARVADALSQRGTSVEDVTRRAAGLLESLQKLKPR